MNSDSSSREIRQFFSRVMSLALAVITVSILTVMLKYAGQGGTQVEPEQIEMAHTTYGLVTVPLLAAIMTVVILYLVYIHTRAEDPE